MSEQDERVPALIPWTASQHPVNSALLDYIDAVIRHAMPPGTIWPADQPEVAAQLRAEFQERLSSLSPGRRQ